MTLCLYRKGAQCDCQPQDGIACPDIPRFNISLGGYGGDSIIFDHEPEGEWVRWSDVQRAILDPLTRCPADGVPGTHGCEACETLGCTGACGVPGPDGSKR